MEERKFIYSVSEGNCGDKEMIIDDLDIALERFQGNASLYQFDIWEKGVKIKNFNSSRSTAEDILKFLNL
ncbi:hypothetical protein ABGV42_01315 [Paenibacillus pabuli]|uniref:hypothetical protein n=1 Tax=Paenibacillus pabuli TaxID=1472 RepID=UPI00324227A9